MPLMKCKERYHHQVKSRPIGFLLRCFDAEIQIPGTSLQALLLSPLPSPETRIPIIYLQIECRTRLLVHHRASTSWRMPFVYLYYFPINPNEFSNKPLMVNTPPCWLSQLKPDSISWIIFQINNFSTSIHVIVVYSLGKKKLKIKNAAK